MIFDEKDYTVRMSLWEWCNLAVYPKDYWKKFPQKDRTIQWPKWAPKQWKFSPEKGVWYLERLHIGLTQRAYFYSSRIILRPTKNELKWIEQERAKSYFLPFEGNEPLMYECPKESLGQ